MAIMSDSSIALNPVMEEPSKPMPFSKASSNSAELMLNDFSWPRMSVNQKRMNRSWCSSTRALTSSTVRGASLIAGTLEDPWCDAGRKLNAVVSRETAAGPLRLAVEEERHGAGRGDGRVGDLGGGGGLGA